jgi:hypothetical protein
MVRSLGAGALSAAKTRNPVTWATLMVGESNDADPELPFAVDETVRQAGEDTFTNAKTADAGSRLRIRGDHGDGRVHVGTEPGWVRGQSQTVIELGPRVGVPDDRDHPYFSRISRIT